MRNIRRAVVLFAASIASLTAAKLPFDAAEASNKLGIELLQKISENDPGNLLISPYSLSSVLAPLYLGSAGSTQSELASVLHFSSAPAAFENAFSALRSRLSSTTADGAKSLPAFQSANRFFLQQGVTTRGSFTTRLTNSLGFDVKELDFTQPASASATINSWVSEQTQGKIPAVVSPDALSPDTQLVLINALYFRADWQHKFSPDRTGPSPFHVNGTGETEHRTTMRRTARMYYAQEDGFQVVALPYTNDDYQCLIILPSENADSLKPPIPISAGQLHRWSRLTARKATLVELYLPSFSFQNTARSLSAALKNLGMRSAFDEPNGSANFDPISPRTEKSYLAVSDVLQSTFVAVDEEGTEAAAATSVALATLGAAQRVEQPVEMHVNRPFLFAIQHSPTGTCLFLGRVVDPKEN